MNQLAAEDVPPQDTDAEAALIASAITDPERTLEAARGISLDDFYLQKHRVLWGAIVALRSRGSNCDPILLKGYLDDNHAITEAGGLDYIASLGSLTFTSASCADYANRVRDVAAKRAVSQSAHVLDSLSKNGMPAAELIERARQETDFLHRAYATAKSEWKWTTSDALMAEEEKPEDFLWPEVVARGHVTLLAAFAKAGKSFLEYAHLGALSRQEPWLDHKALDRPVRATIVSEEGPGPIRRRCRRFGVLGAQILPVGAAPLGTRWETLIERSADRARDSQSEILVIDTLSSLAAFGEDDENKSSAVIKTFLPLRHFAATHNLAVVVIHHGNKAGGAGGRGIRGSGAFVQAPDELVELEVEGQEGSTRRSLRYRGRFDAPRLAQVVEYIPSDPYASYRLVGSQDDAKVAERNLKVLAILTVEAGWLSREEIVEANRPIRKQTTESALMDLYDRRAIQRVGTGVRGKPFLYANLACRIEDQPIVPQ